MRKKTQRIFAGILAVIISIAMIGAGIIGLFFSDDDQMAGNQASAQAANAVAEYQGQKQSLEAMAKQAEIDPDNLPLLKALADGYYKIGLMAQYTASAEIQNEVQGHFEHAVEAYRKVLAKEKDINTILNLATVAFYSGQDSLAEESYQDALTQNPEYVKALAGYGAFLFYAKQDYAGALQQLQKALPLAQEDAEKEQIQYLITSIQNQQEASNSSGTLTPDEE